MNTPQLKYKWPFAIRLAGLSLALGLTACQDIKPSDSVASTPIVPAALQSESSANTPETVTENASPKLPLLEFEMETLEGVDARELANEVLQAHFADLTTEEKPLENYIFSHPNKSYSTLWPKISDQLFLASAHKEDFEDYLRYYLRHKSYLKRVSKRAEPYLYHILNEVNERHMPYEVALLPVVESGFYPFAKSYVSAAGLWQFMPATGHMFGLKRNWWYDGRQDVLASTDAALTYLQKLYKMNNYDWLLALASYNAGLGNVLKAQKRYLKKHPNKTKADANFWNIRNYLPKETKHYVPQLLAISYLVKHRNQYQIGLHPIANQPYFETLQLDQQIALNRVAERLELHPEKLQILNPGYLRPAMPPKGPFTLVLPKPYAEQFKQAYAEDQSTFKVRWSRHTIRSGESLSLIAYRYKTSVKAIKQLNQLSSNRIRAGKTLLIPVPKSYIATLDQRKPKTLYKGNKFIHQVKSGESLWTIARYYNITTRTLCEWNGISIRKPLRTGQKLEIRSSKYGRKLSHTLKKGESLWTLAQKYNVTTKDIANWNGIKRSTILQPGQTLEVWIKG